MMNEFLPPLLGGTLIGFASILLLYSNGKIAGISGIIGNLFRAPLQMNGWRFAFLGGLFSGGLLFRIFGDVEFIPLIGRSTGSLLAAGLLVGIGTQIGSGCTSGHGVCGIGRLSPRSLTATLTFIVTGAITVYIVNHVLGGVV